jgi:hypothetical protein
MSKAASSFCALVFGAVASLMLFAAVWLPSKPPARLEHLIGLGHGDPDAATAWLRWAFVAAAVLLIALPRLWTRAVWVEVLVATLLAVGVYAALKQYRVAEKAAPAAAVPAAEQTILVNLPQAQRKLVSDVTAGGPLVILVVHPDKAVGRRITYATTRYEATAATKLPVKPAKAAQIVVSVKRGKSDAAVAAFLAELQTARAIYVLNG